MTRVDHATVAGIEISWCDLEEPALHSATEGGMHAQLAVTEIILTLPLPLVDTYDARPTPTAIDNEGIAALSLLAERRERKNVLLRPEPHLRVEQLGQS